MNESTKAQIDAACELADYHINEIIEGLIPEVEFLSEAMKQDIRRRLNDCFYEGIYFANDKKKPE